VVFALFLTCAAAAQDEKDARIDELINEVAELKSEVHRLQADAGDNWLSEQRADEIRNLVHDVLADADTRASLLQDGLTAGYDKHFFMGSADGNFLMQLYMKLQTRFVYNNADQLPGEDEEKWGFEQRRTELYWAGHVLDPKLTYKVKVAASRSDGKVNLDDAYLGYKINDAWKITAGQFKAPFLREYLTSSGRQQAVERSYINHTFNVNRSQGVQLAYNAEKWRAMAMLHDGTKAKNTAFASDVTDFAFAARAEMLLAGAWKQFKDFASWPGEEFGLLLGAALDYEVGETGSGTDNPDFTRYTVDLGAEFGGWNIYTALVGQSIDDNGSASFVDADQYGFLLQGGLFLIPDELDVFARYEYLDLDGVSYDPEITTATAILDDDLNLVTLGMNYYFKKHTAKLTCDLIWVLDPLPEGDSGAGLRTSVDDDQFVLRTQIQLYF
jgi:hypothetical protein